MNALERYIQLKNEGKQDNEIVLLMQEEGFQMSEINDALNQSKIKDALNQQPTYNEVGVPQPTSEFEEQPIYEDYYSYSQPESLETTTEVIEQIITKKLKEILDSLNNLKKDKDYVQKEVENLKERLKRIEDNFDSVQRAIIGKIGEFGENSKIIQKDLENIHNTMSKLMNPLVDTYNELKSLKEQKETKG